MRKFKVAQISTSRAVALHFKAVYTVSDLGMGHFAFPKILTHLSQNSTL